MPKLSNRRPSRSPRAVTSIDVAGTGCKTLQKTPEIKASEQPTRRLTLTYSAYDHHRDGQWTGSCRYPMLRLSGLWLQRAGFDIGQRVQVRVHAGRLEIVPSV